MSLAGIICWAPSRGLALPSEARKAPRIAIENLDILVVSNMLGFEAEQEPAEADESLTPILLEE
jgi:hypothetical protein